MSEDTRVTGFRELEAGLRKRFSDILKFTGAGLFMEAEETMGESKRETPVDHGPLVNSGHVQLPEFSQTEVSVQLGFGGPAGSGNQGGSSNDEDVGYATHVHENVTAFHNPPTKAKYLEDPVKKRQAGMPARLVRRVNKRLKS